MMLRRLTARQLTFDVVVSVLCVLARLAMTVGFNLAEITFVLCMGAALATRRLSPPIALAIAWLGAVVQMFGGFPPDLANLAILAVLYATAAYGSPRVKWLGLISAGVGALVAATYLVLLPSMMSGWEMSPASIPIGSLPVTLFVFAFTVGAMVTLLGLSWTLGLLTRTRAAAKASREAQVRAEEEERQARQQAIVEQERNRIARDMHDVVAHSLAVVIAQADGARFALRADPDAASGALSTIASVAREALGDVRVLLEQLRHSQVEGPQPTLDDLRQLLEQVRASGLPVSDSTIGIPREISPAHQMAVYRIVQEALTNVLRHGDAGRPVSVVFDWTKSDLSIVIDSATHGAVSPERALVGHGLAGMRERATLIGGTFAAGPRGDRFVVEASIPAPEVSSPPSTQQHGVSLG